MSPASSWLNPPDIHFCIIAAGTIEVYDWPPMPATSSYHFASYSSTGPFQNHQPICYSIQLSYSDMKQSALPSFSTLSINPLFCLDSAYWSFSITLFAILNSTLLTQVILLYAWFVGLTSLICFLSSLSIHRFILRVFCSPTLSSCSSRDIHELCPSSIDNSPLLFNQLLNVSVPLIHWLHSNHPK